MKRKLLSRLLVHWIQHCFTYYFLGQHFSNFGLQPDFCWVPEHHLEPTTSGLPSLPPEYFCWQACFGQQEQMQLGSTLQSSACFGPSCVMFLLTKNTLSSVNTFQGQAFCTKKICENSANQKWWWWCDVTSCHYHHFQVAKLCTEGGLQGGNIWEPLI